MFRQIAAAVSAVLSAITTTFETATQWLMKGGKWVLESRLVSVAKLVPGVVLNTVGGVARALTGVQATPALPQPQRQTSDRGEQELTEAVRELGRRPLRRSLARDPIAAVWRYACASESARKDMDISHLPREVHFWLESLNDDELQTLRQVGLRAAVLHCRGEEWIPGLRGVRRLVQEGELLAPHREEQPQRKPKFTREGDLARARELGLLRVAMVVLFMCLVAGSVGPKPAQAAGETYFRNWMPLVATPRVAAPTWTTDAHLGQVNEGVSFSAQIVAAGVPERETGEDLSAWLDRVMSSGVLRKVGHPENYAYVLLLARSARRSSAEATANACRIRS